jgi:hypothetical protein
MPSNSNAQVARLPSGQGKNLDKAPGNSSAAKELGWHARQQRGGKWHTACPKYATDDWKLWSW